MSFLLLGTCLSLATFGAVTLAASAALRAVWPLARARVVALEPGARSLWLLALRVAPTALGVLTTLSVAVPSFLEYEPRDTNEVAGGGLEGLALAGLVLAGLGTWRLAVAARRTRRVARSWSRGAMAVDLDGTELGVFRLETPFPIVALRGWRRPALLVAGSVLERCRGRMLLAIAAHEEGHRRAADNWKRMLLAACADALAIGRAGSEIVALWEAAAEEAADDHAVAAGARPGDLAEALVAVARLAGPAVWPAMPAPAFYRGADLDRRVRRLLEMPRRAAAPPTPRRCLRRAMAALLFAGAVIWGADALHRPLHRLLERTVAGNHAELRALVVPGGSS